MQDAETKEISSSPLPQEEPEVQKTMGFPEAVSELLIGKRIQRLQWHDSEYGFMKHWKWTENGETIEGDFLTIHRREEDHQWILGIGDMNATDWVSF